MGKSLVGFFFIFVFSDFWMGKLRSGGVGWVGEDWEERRWWMGNIVVYLYDGMY